MEPITSQTEPKRINPGTTRTQYQSPKIAHLGGLEQLTLSCLQGGTGDTFYTTQFGQPLTGVLTASCS